MPALLKDKKFEFVSQALPQDAFGVVNFKGSEGFSTCYQFEIMLVSNDSEIDITTVLQNPAVFTILRNDGDIPFHGILAQFEQLQAVDDVVFYRALLVPKLWWLSLTHHNQIFLDKTIPEILEDVLKDGGLTTKDFQLKLQNSYPTWEFICQYRESHLNFVSRWMEREGMYYYFEQSDAGEKMIITDTNLSHTPMAEGQTMYYSPPTGLDETRREEVIHAFILKQKLLPGRLHLQDYNYRTPSVNLSAQAPVSEQGRGEIHIYGEHFRTLQEGSGLSQIRVQELLSHEKRFHGESTIPYLRPGYRFELEHHYRNDFNQPYLTIELMHEGSQTGFLVSGIRQSLSATEEKPYYRNTFVTLPAVIQYRHPKQTSKPSFNGAIHARVDAEGSGKYAQLDEQGRYKIVLPFDLSGRKDGKASHWMRMAQPYAGENQGMHFPLHKHTEVLLTFIEGDPDRPIIAAAIPNPESRSPVTSRNQTKAVIQTGIGPKTGSIGAEYVYGQSGGSEGTGNTDNNYMEFDDTVNKNSIVTHTPKEKSYVRLGDSYSDPYLGHDANSPSEPGIRIRTDKNLWIESNQRYADYKIRGPETKADVPNDIQYLWEKFYGDSPVFAPTNMKKYDYGTGVTNPVADQDVATLKKLAQKGQVKIVKGDTFNTQEGNIYDFGGYWNYNLGNCYVENHIDQKAKLNDAWDKDLAANSTGGPNKDVKCNDLDLSGDVTQPRFEWVWELEGADFHNSAALPDFSKTLSSDKTWIEKTLGGAQYNYTKGTQTLNVEVGTGEETHIYGRASYEYKYSKGKLVYKSASKGGHSEEWKYDRITGVILSHDKTDWLKAGGNIVKSSFSMGNKISSSISLSGDEYFTFNASGKIGMSINLGASASINIAVSRSASLNIASAKSASISIAASTDLTLKAGTGMGLELDFRVGGTVKIDPSGHLKFEGIGITARKEAAMKARKAALETESREIMLDNILTQISKNSMAIENNEMRMQMGFELCGL